MTTTATKSLRERAIAAWEAEEERNARDEAREVARLEHDTAERLRALLAERICAVIDLSSITVTANPVLEEDANPFIARAEVDGVLFSTGNVSSFLWQVLECGAPGCGREVLRVVTDEADVGRHLTGYHECEQCFSNRRTSEGHAPVVDVTPDDYIASVEEAGKDLAAATAEVMRLADERAAEKSAAIQRLVGTENPENGRAHSASSAKDVVESDTEYMRYRITERNAEVERIRADAHYRAVQLKAKLAVGQAVRAE